MKELFIEDLKKIQGGRPGGPCRCCNPTTMACCEEISIGCDTCCPPTS